MTISASSVSQALHGVIHHSDNHQSDAVKRARTFSQQLKAAASSTAGSAGTQQSTTTTPGTTAPGNLLSSDMLQAMQTIG